MLEDVGPATKLPLINPSLTELVPNGFNSQCDLTCPWKARNLGLTIRFLS